MNTDTYDLILAATPHTDYVTTSTADELYDAWRASGCNAHYHIVVNTCGDHDALMFRLVPKEPYHPSSFSRVCYSDEYTDNALIVVIALLGLCMVGHVALGWFFS